MDFYPDAGPAVSAAQLQPAAWLIASSPPGFLRNGYLPRLSSIPEGPAEERRAVAQPVQQDLLQHGQCTKVSSSSVTSVGVPAACDDVLHLLEHPSIAAERQQLQQQVTGESCIQPPAHEGAAVGKIRQQRSGNSPFHSSGETSSSSSSSDTCSQEGDEDKAAAAAATVPDDAAAPGDLTAAASTWAMEIRHFTDCLPITPDSVCSSSTYLSLTGAQQHAQKQQQQSQQTQQRPLQHSSQQAAAVRTCSLPHSSSSASLPQHCSSDGDAAAAATEAALQASLAALQELDDLEWCPWDRVAKWLDSHEAAAVGAPGTEQQPQQPGSVSDAALGSGSSSSLQLASSSSLTAAGEVCAGEQQQQQQQGAADEPVFDAPAWWQEAVLERLEQQRQAFHGSWWCRARVLASLAATRAACALQI